MNDFIAIIMLLAISNALIYASKNTSFKIERPIDVIAFSLSAGIFWEVITPLYKSNATFDLFDMMVYLLGGVSYSLIIRASQHLRKC